MSHDEKVGKYSNLRRQRTTYQSGRWTMNELVLTMLLSFAVAASSDCALSRASHLLRHHSAGFIVSSRGGSGALLLHRHRAAARRRLHRSAPVCMPEGPEVGSLIRLDGAGCCAGCWEGSAAPLPAAVPRDVVRSLRAANAPRLPRCPRLPREPADRGTWHAHRTVTARPLRRAAARPLRRPDDSVDHSPPALPAAARSKCTPSRSTRSSRAACCSARQS